MQDEIKELRAEVKSLRGGILAVESYLHSPKFSIDPNLNKAIYEAWMEGYNDQEKKMETVQEA